MLREPHRPLVLVLCPWPQVGAGDEDLSVSCAHAAEYFASSLAGERVHLVLPAELEAHVDGELFDPVADRLGHIPFTNEVQCAIATAAARRLNAEICSPAIKVIAVDCDNTLWGNTVSEVGPEGLVLEAHHLALHERLQIMAQRGTLVCLCSRNEGALVEAALRELEGRGLVLKMGQHILQTMLGVSPGGSKADSLRRLARHLNVSLASFALIDDNPAECAHVHADLPDVHVCMLPPAADAVMRTLLYGAWMLVPRVSPPTAEDSKRTLLYQENMDRTQLATRATSLASLLHSLQVQVEVCVMSEGEQGRIAQLTERTNQFNAHKVILSTSEVSALHLDPQALVLAVRLADRYGDYGLVATATLRPSPPPPYCALSHSLSDFLVQDTQQVRGGDVPHEGGCDMRIVAICDVFTMSCRALGRGVEHALLARLAVEARGLQGVSSRWCSPCGDCTQGMMLHTRHQGMILLRTLPLPHQRNRPVLTFLAAVAAAMTGAQYVDSVGWLLPLAPTALLTFDMTSHTLGESEIPQSDTPWSDTPESKTPWSETPWSDTPRPQPPGPLSNLDSSHSNLDSSAPHSIFDSSPSLPSPLPLLLTSVEEGGGGGADESVGKKGGTEVGSVRRAHTVWLASTLSASLYPTGGRGIAPMAGTGGIAPMAGTKVLVQGGSHLALHALDLTSAAGVLKAVLSRRRRTLAVPHTRHSAHTPSTCVKLPAVCASDLVPPYSLSLSTPLSAQGGWRGRRKRNKKALGAGAALPVPLALTALQAVTPHGMLEETGMQGRGQAQGVEGADERAGVQERDAAWYASRRHKAHRQVALELQTLWAQVLCLHVRDVELNVPFMEYGGDSLMAIEVLSLAAASNVALADAASLTANFEMLSIQDLVSKAVSSHAASACPLSCAAAAVPSLSLSLS